MKDYQFAAICAILFMIAANTSKSILASLGFHLAAVVLFGLTLWAMKQKP